MLHSPIGIRATCLPSNVMLQFVRHDVVSPEPMGRVRRVTARMGHAMADSGSAPVKIAWHRKRMCFGLWCLFMELRVRLSSIPSDGGPCVVAGAVLEDGETFLGRGASAGP